MLMPVSLNNESKNNSVRLGAAINSAKTVAVTTEGSAPECGIQRRLCSGAKTWVPIPESNNDSSVDGCRHRARSSRNHRTIPFLPELIPGFPIPLNFAKGLLVLTGRTRTAFSSPSNNNLSPGRTPSIRRTSRGHRNLPLTRDSRLFLQYLTSKIPCFSIPSPYFQKLGSFTHTEMLRTSYGLFSSSLISLSWMAITENQQNDCELQQATSPVQL